MPNGLISVIVPIYKAEAYLRHCIDSILSQTYQDFELILVDNGPSEFLSYIKHADYVFTDSFHASVFSLIYHKDFFVFNRKGQKGMSNRIESLTYLFDVKDRYCDSKQKSTLKYVESLPFIEISRNYNNACAYHL